MATEEKGTFTVIWKIENFSNCLLMENERLLSPEFIVNSLYASRWHIRLYPKGQDNCLTYFLVYVDSEIMPFKTDYQLSLVDKSGKALNHLKRKATFLPHCGQGTGNFQSLKDVYETKKSIYLPQDTLTVCCRLCTTSKDMREDVQCFARTRIGVKRLSKIWSIDNFSQLSLKDAVTTTVGLSRVDDTPLILKVLSGGILEKWLNIQIKLEKYTEKSMVSCKISVLNRYGKVVKEMEDKHKFLPRELAWNFPKFISSKELNAKKRDLLPQDTLSLKFEFTLEVRVEYESIESTHYGLPAPSPSEQRQNTTNLENGSSLKSCMLDLYHDKTLSDFELKAENMTFHVHKTILCARSTVFKTILSSDVLEPNSKSLSVLDVDADTLNKFLLYVYTDAFDNLELESVVKLYYAADKYQVLSLVCKCSSALKSFLTVPNVGEILAIADKHQDHELTSTVHDFILEYDEEILQSTEWLNFEKRDSQLAVKTMCEVYKKKLQNKTQ